MKKSKMQKLIDNTTEKDLPYIFIPSYNRPNFVLGRILKTFSEKALRQKVFIVVRAEQYKTYKRENPNFEFVVIPKGAVSGVGSTRQFILDYAIENRLPCIMDMDDDIKFLSWLYDRRTAKGELCLGHTTLEDLKNDPLMFQKVLQLAGKISREIFKEHPDVLLGGLGKQHFCNANPPVKYIINRGKTPRQIKILNVKGIKKAGIRMPDEFNLHGDDIGFAAEVLQNGYSCFYLPCLCYDYVDEKVDSVVRDPKNPDKNRWLHELEYNALQKMEIKHYLRETFKFPDGQYKFGDIDWQKYHKLHNTTPIIQEWE